MSHCGPRPVYVDVEKEQTLNHIMVRRALVAGAAAVVLLAASGCGGSGHSGSGSGHGSAAVPAGTPSAGVAFNDADVAFAQHMIVHHRQAVEMADLAAERAGSASVKTLAADIKAAQAPEIATMTTWLGTWGAAAPDGHGAGHETMPGMMSEADMTKLAGAQGDAFDERFLTMMIAHHEGAITMAQTEVSDGSSPEAKTLAGKITAAQQAEIAAMKTLLAAG